MLLARGQLHPHLANRDSDLRDGLPGVRIRNLV